MNILKGQCLKPRIHRTQLCLTCVKSFNPLLQFFPFLPCWRKARFWYLGYCSMIIRCCSVVACHCMSVLYSAFFKVIISKLKQQNYREASLSPENMILKWHLLIICQLYWFLNVTQKRIILLSTVPNSMVSVEFFFYKIFFIARPIVLCCTLMFPKSFI